MFDFAICEVNSKQYKIFPNQPIEVDLLGEAAKKVEVNVLMLSEGGQVKIGTPFLKEKLSLDCLEVVKGKKIRVAKFHAKANYRKVTGARAKKTKVVYSVKSNP
ncbi:50S ribosomal protein L21 [Candidatus Daviesbacteria bacterium]|nr:50S ribosomal protein L21 [Candidatus Daviesbacteria bacterium]